MPRIGVWPEPGGRAWRQSQAGQQGLLCKLGFPQGHSRGSLSRGWLPTTEQAGSGARGKKGKDMFYKKFGHEERAGHGSAA